MNGKRSRASTVFVDAFLRIVNDRFDDRMSLFDFAAGLQGRLLISKRSLALAAYLQHEALLDLASLPRERVIFV